MTSRIIEQPFTLYQDDPVIATADGVADTWSDVWKYQMPIGSSFVIKPEHTFSVYINDGSEVGSSTCQVKIEKRDSSGSDVLVVLGPKLYAMIKEFQEKSKLTHFNVPPEGVVINEREYFVIVIKDDGTVTESTCYFEARIARIRKSLGA